MAGTHPVQGPQPESRPGCPASTIMHVTAYLQKDPAKGPCIGSCQDFKEPMLCTTGCRRWTSHARCQSPQHALLAVGIGSISVQQLVQRQILAIQTIRFCLKTSAGLATSGIFQARKHQCSKIEVQCTAGLDTECTSRKQANRGKVPSARSWAYFPGAGKAANLPLVVFHILNIQKAFLRSCCRI